MEGNMKIVRHADLPGEERGPGVTRRITVDRSTGAGAITAAVIHLEPGGTIPPHTHLVEEAMTLMEGQLRILVGEEQVEIGAGTSWHAPANTVHGARNVGQTQAVMVIAYPAIEVAAFRVEVDF
jgi:quercetin dioxygenase-like cupin family protein